MDTNKILTGLIITFIAGSVGMKTYQILKHKIKEHENIQNDIKEEMEGP